jgi:hypothetical protein
MGLVSFSVQAAIMSLNNINGLICLGEVLCFLCGTDWILKYYLDELRLQMVKGYDVVETPNVMTFWKK